MNRADEFSEPPCSSSWNEIRQWRKQMREHLVAKRLEIDSSVRRDQGEAAKRCLRENVDLRRYETIGVYWPMRGEIDLLDLARAHVGAGGRIALPVVVQRSAPVEFWNWRPDAPLDKGLWDIPIPATREVVQPDALLIPLVGFDPRGYRLGYGGGYYDRTIAAAPRRPHCFGLGYAAAELTSICPQPHDMPMDAIATERAFFRRT